MTEIADIFASVTDPAFLIVVGPISLVAALFVWAEHRTDRIRRNREEENRKTLAYIASLDEWEDDPRFRADIAKTNRQKSGQRQMRDVWERPFGGGHDAA